jgi:peptidoglycan/xylan/chitin deacetylase (PgdA/CDA1 family)
LGKDSGTATKSIIEPTDKILKLLKQYDSKAIFFVDATYLMALKKYNHPDLVLIEKQLEDIVSMGSSVELHLHPQWLDAKPDKDRWVFESFDRYRLHSLSKEEINQLFKDGIDILENITKQKVKAFRAGGWSITPFSSLNDAFIENDIKLDMSVLPGFYKNELPMHFYDFTKTPKKEYYKFNEDVCVESSTGLFLEVPVTTYKMYGIDLAINNIIKKFTNKKIYGDGKGLETSNVPENKLKRLFTNNIRSASIESQSNYFFMKSLKKLENRKILSYVMHPKTLCDISLINFEYLIKSYKTVNTNDILKEYS